MKKFANYTKWLLALCGVLMIILACIIFANPFTSAWSVANLVGWIMMIAGIIDVIAFAFNFDRFYAGWMLVRGLATGLIGSVLAFRPVESVSIFMMVFGFWVIIMGAVQFANSFVTKSLGQKEWFWPALGGIIEIIAGVIIIMNPNFSLAVSAYFIAACLLVDGVVDIITAFRIQKGLNDVKRWEKALKNVFAEES